MLSMITHFGRLAIHSLYIIVPLAGRAASTPVGRDGQHSSVDLTSDHSNELSTIPVRIFGQDIQASGRTVPHTSSEIDRLGTDSGLQPLRVSPVSPFDQHMQAKRGHAVLPGNSEWGDELLRYYKAHSDSLFHPHSCLLQDAPQSSQGGFPQKQLQLSTDAYKFAETHQASLSDDLKWQSYMLNHADHISANDDQYTSRSSHSSGRGQNKAGRSTNSATMNTNKNEKWKMSDKEKEAITMQDFPSELDSSGEVYIIEQQRKKEKRLEYYRQRNAARKASNPNMHKDRYQKRKEKDPEYNKKRYAKYGRNRRSNKNSGEKISQSADTSKHRTEGASHELGPDQGYVNTTMHSQHSGVRSSEGAQLSPSSSAYDEDGDIERHLQEYVSPEVPVNWAQLDI